MITNQIAELHFIYGNQAAWDEQMHLLAQDGILHTEDYEHIPGDIALWKMDDELRHPVTKEQVRQWMDRKQGKGKCKNAYNRLCVGIGTYSTQQDGEIYLCAILDSVTRKVAAYSLGVYRNAELVEKALENFFSIYEKSCTDIVLLSSQNPVYKSKLYEQVTARFPINTEMTKKGTRGGAFVVSTYFSQLMRRKSGTVFQTWQDAVDWLVMDILNYNLGKESI